jgi:hypothetical protein
LDLLHHIKPLSFNTKSNGIRKTTTPLTKPKKKTFEENADLVVVAN